jgi:hypothetical protein
MNQVYEVVSSDSKYDSSITHALNGCFSQYVTVYELGKSKNFLFSFNADTLLLPCNLTKVRNLVVIGCFKFLSRGEYFSFGFMVSELISYLLDS